MFPIIADNNNNFKSLDINTEGDSIDYTIQNTIIQFPCTAPPSSTRSIVVASIIDNDDYEAFEDLEISIGGTNIESLSLVTRPSHSLLPTLKVYKTVDICIKFYISALATYIDSHNPSSQITSWKYLWLANFCLVQRKTSYMIMY